VCVRLFVCVIVCVRERNFVHTRESESERDCVRKNVCERERGTEHTHDHERDRQRETGGKEKRKRKIESARRWEGKGGLGAPERVKRPKKLQR